MSRLLALLARGVPLVSDGAMGTLLMEAGLEAGACPDAMSLDHPDAVARIARRYVEAGADLVHTNTFGASTLKLAEYGLEKRTGEINAAAVATARRGAEVAHTRRLEVAPNCEAPLVSASVGPSGRLLEPYGDTAEEVVYDSFRRQAAALLEAGVDAVTVETMTDLREAVLAVRAVRSLDPDRPVLATMTFQATPRGFVTVMGVTVKAAVEALVDAGAWVVGSNCGNGVAVMTELARAFRDVTDRPLMIQANAGVPVLRVGAVAYPETPEDFAAAAPGLLDAGVSILGGCCGTDPAHVLALRRAVDARR